MDYVHGYLKTFDEVKWLVNQCKQTGYCCHDFETNGGHFSDPNSYITMISISFQPGYSYAIPLGHKDSPLRRRWIKVLKYIGRELIENTEIIKIAQNLKFEYNWWRKYGITMLGILNDTMLAKYVLNEERPHGLKEMVNRYIPEFAGYDLKGVPSSKASRAKHIQFWSNVPLEELTKYGALDGDLTHRLWVFLENRLYDNGFHPLYRNLLMMSTRVLADVEWNGMYTDRTYLEKLMVTYEERIDKCLKDLRSLPDLVTYEEIRIGQLKKNMIRTVKAEIEDLKEEGGSARMIASREIKISRYLLGEYTTKKEQELVEPINFGSTKQLIELFHTSEDGFEWDIVSYTVNKATKRRTDTPALGEDNIKILKTRHDHPILDKLLEYRGLTKMNSTYVVGMYEKLQADDRIYGSFLIHGTVTGRLSSRNPNLQNIPRDTTAEDIKKMFIAPPGYLILHLDYSQAELRVMAYLAQEETMMHWFAIGRDIHLATACKKYGVEYDDIWPIYKNEDDPEYVTWKIRRKQAKTTNFGIAYEQGPKKLAEKLTEQGIPTTEDEAKRILDDWFTDFPKIKRFINRQHKRVERDGFVTNLFGRKRRLAQVLDEGNKWQKAEAFRQAVNSPIQGSASDFALFSSVLIREAIMSGELPPMKQFGTVHDSLLYYIKPENIHKAIPILARICANPETMTWFNFEVKGVEMKVDFDIGKNWGVFKKYNLQEDYIKFAA